MGIFEEFRDQGWNTYYGPLRTGVVFDINVASVAYMSALITLACIILILGSRKQEIVPNTIRMALFLTVCIAILVMLYSSDWRVMSTTITDAYSLFDERPFRGSLRVNIGLNSVNISMRGDIGESYVYYNERMNWWGVHEAEDDYKAALRKGLPLPLLDAMEYFAQGIKQLDLDKTWEFRIGGYYTYVLLWASFALWLVGTIMTFIVPLEAGCMLCLVGFLLLLSSIIYAETKPRYPLVVRISGQLMTPSFGWPFHCCIVTGVLAVAYGLCIIILQKLQPVRLAQWFGIAEEAVEEPSAYIPAVSLIRVTSTSTEVSGDLQRLETSPTGRQSRSYDVQGGSRPTTSSTSDQQRTPTFRHQYGQQPSPATSTTGSDVIVRVGRTPSYDDGGAMTSSTLALAESVTSYDVRGAETSSRAVPDQARFRYYGGGYINHAMELTRL